MFVETAEHTFEQNGDETKPALHLAATESPFSRKKIKIRPRRDHRQRRLPGRRGRKIKFKTPAYRDRRPGSRGRFYDAPGPLRFRSGGKTQQRHLRDDLLRRFRSHHRPGQAKRYAQYKVRDGRSGPHDSYEGSPASKGILQPEMWGVQTDDSMWDWTRLRADLKEHGCESPLLLSISRVRNSLVTAPMPTASTAQIVGFNECIEPYTSNLYSRRVRAGEFVVANQHLVRDLAGLGESSRRSQLTQSLDRPVGRADADRTGA